MESASDLIIRPAERRDFAALAEVERETFGKQGIEPYGEKYFDAWIETNGQGFIVAEKNGEVVGYAYSQTVMFDPFNRAADMTYDAFTDSGYTVGTHDPNGNTRHIMSAAAVIPGTGRSLMRQATQRAEEDGVSYILTFSRIPGFSSWLSYQNDLAHAEYDLALWYAKENARMVRSIIWPNVTSHVFPQLPSITKLDPVLATQLRIKGAGLLDVQPNCMHDPMSHHFAALLVRKLTP